MYPDDIDLFNEKLDKIENHIYTIEEEVKISNGVYEAELQHDNILNSTVRVYTGPKLTGDRIDNYMLSTPSNAPWKRFIKIFSNLDILYITYETPGDTVEADDINKLQESVIRTQRAINGYKKITDEDIRKLKSDKANAADLHKVAGSGKYSDLINAPNVINNVTSISSNDCLSANQGKILSDLITDLDKITVKNNIVLSGTDFNTMRTPGFYTIKSGINKPPTGTYHSLIVLISYSSVYIHQIAITDAKTDIYIRYSINSTTWTAWVKIPTIADVPTKLSQLENDTGIGGLPSKFTWNMLKGV